MTSFLDLTGLTYFWGKIKIVLNGKADASEAIKDITRSSTTFTATRCNGDTFTFTQQDNNNIPQGWCGTAAGTAAKTASCSNYTAAEKSYLMVVIRYSNTSASALTLNVNSQGAKAIYINGEASSATNYTLSAGSYLTYYDGSKYYFRTDGKIPGDMLGVVHTTGNEEIGGQKMFTSEILKAGYALSNNVSTSYFGLRNNQSNSGGACIFGYGKDATNNAGALRLIAYTTRSVELRVNPDGTLFFDGLNIIANMNYVADCNAALVPGKYRTSTTSINSPMVGCIGNLDVIGNTTLWRTQRFTPVYTSETPVFARWVQVTSAGAFSSATPWKIVSYFEESIPSPYMITDVGSDTSAPPTFVSSPKDGGKLAGYGGGSNYNKEFVRFYHDRDITRDSELTSYLAIGKWTENQAPTTGNGNRSRLMLAVVEGGQVAGLFNFYGTFATYSDVTESTVIEPPLSGIATGIGRVYGKRLEVGDVYEGQTIDEVSYGVEMSDVSFYFSYDNQMSIGLSNKRVSVVYAATGAIDTSDSRTKSSMVAVPDDVLDAWGDVSWQQYTFNDAVEKKGSGARVHTGVVAQQIAEAFEKRNLDAGKYGFFCHDEWADEVETDEETGKKRTVQESGDIYGVRYTEALAIEAAYLRRRVKQLEERVSKLAKVLEK